MEKTTRRHLLKAAAVGGVTATGLGAMLGAAPDAAAGAPESGSDHAHDHQPSLDDKHAVAVVSFGQWEVDRDDTRGPIDRMATPVPPPNRNVHKVLPFEVEIGQGGGVSFIISGFHQILIYEGRTLEDVQAGFAREGSTLPGGPGLVQYTPDRVYRGLDPFTQTGGSVDRVESVNFLRPGRYLVVCGVLPHFLEGMHGFVKVDD